MCIDSVKNVYRMIKKPICTHVYRQTCIQGELIVLIAPPVTVATLCFKFKKYTIRLLKNHWNFSYYYVIKKYIMCIVSVYYV